MSNLDFDPTVKLRVTMPMTRRKEVEINGRVRRMPPQTYQLFICMLIARGRYFNRVDLVEELWENPEDQPKSALNIVSTYIKDMRKYGIPVETFRGIGWRIPLPVEKAQ